MATLALNHLAGLLECPVCLDGMEDPRILPCGHIVCLECVQKLIVGKKKEKKAKCPTCRKNTKIEKTAKDLPKAYVVKDMQEHIKKVRETEEKKKTQNDPSTAASSPPPSSSSTTTAQPSQTSEGWLTKHDNDIMTAFHSRREQEEKDHLMAEELQRQLAREVEEEERATRQGEGGSAGNGLTETSTNNPSLYPDLGTISSQPGGNPPGQENTQTDGRKPWQRYNINEWPFSDLRDAYNTTTDFEFMTVIRDEIERRTAAYKKWKTASMSRPIDNQNRPIDNNNREIDNQTTNESISEQSVATPIEVSSADSPQNSPSHDETEKRVSESDTAEMGDYSVDSLQNPLYDTADNILGLEIQEIEQYLADKKREGQSKLAEEENIPLSADDTAAPKDDQQQQPGLSKKSEAERHAPSLPPPRRKPPLPNKPLYENVFISQNAKQKTLLPPPVPDRPSLAKKDPEPSSKPLSRGRPSQKEEVIITKAVRPSSTVEEQFQDHTPLKRAFSKQKSVRIKAPNFSGKLAGQTYIRIPVMDQEAAKLGEKKIRGWWLAHFDGQRVARQLDTHLDFDPVLRVAGVDDKMMCELCLDETGLKKKIGAEIQGETFEKEWNKCNGDQYLKNLGAKVASLYLRAVLDIDKKDDPQQLVERL